MIRVLRFIVSGLDLKRMPELLAADFSGHYAYSSDRVFVLFNEEGYLRINSNLMTAIIMDFAGPQECRVEIISGGGDTELDFDWGAEKKENRQMVKIFVELCARNSWGMTEPSSGDSEARGGDSLGEVFKRMLRPEKTDEE